MMIVELVLRVLEVFGLTYTGPGDEEPYESDDRFYPVE